MKQKLLLKTMLLLFALIAGSSSVWAGEIVFADLGLENGVQYSDPFDGGDFTVTFAGGGNDGKYYDQGNGIRVYGGGTMTITGKTANITNIVITYDGANAPESDDVVNVGTYNSTTHTWTGYAASVVFTRPSGSGHWRVKSISINRNLFTWDLSTNSFVSATENLVTWASTYATMTLAKGTSSTKANNYLGGGSYNHTRCYQNQTLKITPVPGYRVIKAEITAVSGYAAGFTGNDWTNASKSTSGSLVTITPTDGTKEFYVTISEACRATAVKVYCESCTASVTVTVTPAGWATYCSPYALDFIGDIANLTDAYIITGGNGTVVTTESVKGVMVAANTGLLIKGSEGTITIPVVAVSGTDYTGTNKLVGVTSETTLDLDSDDDGTADQNVYVLMNDATYGLGFYLTTTTFFTLGANTAYLPSDFAGSSAPKFMSIGDDNNGTTGVETLNVERGTLNDNSYYNLNGQRVAQPTKGLYIVNGRKVVIK